MIQYSLDELIKFVDSEIETLIKLRDVFVDEPKDSLAMDENVSKFKQINEELFRLKNFSE